MAHEISIARAEELAYQANIILIMLENHVESLEDHEVIAMVSLCKKMIAPVVSWLIEEQSL